MEKKSIRRGIFNLYTGLVDDEQKFYKYFRMNQYSFHILLRKTENNTKKQT